MPLPVYDLSGLHKSLHRNEQTAEVSCSARASTIQAMSRNKDSTLYQTCLTGKHPFVLAAVVTEARVEAASQYIHQHLYTGLCRTFKSQRQPTVSPLYNALLKVNAKFKDASPYGDSLFPHAVVSACLLDIKTGMLHTISFGPGSQQPYVTSVDSVTPAPSFSKKHFTDGVQVQTAAYLLDAAKHSVVLGSSGLWSELYPRKAAVHARLYASHERTLSASTVSHDPATAVLRAALRSVVARCAPSGDARLAALYNIKQLDRLPPGSKVEAARAGIIPRRRGDVHSDLTALVLAVQVYQPSRGGASSPLAPHLRKSRSLFSLLSSHSRSARAAAEAPALSLTLAEAHASAHRCQAASSALGDLASILQSAEADPGHTPSGAPQRDAELPQEPALRSVRSSPHLRALAPIRLTASMRAPMVAAAPPPLRAHAQRRWSLLRFYVLHVIPADRALQRASWDAALTAVGSTLPQALSRSRASTQKDALSTDAGSPRTVASRSSERSTSGRGGLALGAEAVGADAADGSPPWQRPAAISRVH